MVDDMTMLEVAVKSSLILVPLALAGCMLGPGGTARTRAAYDFHCSEEQVTVQSIGGTSYHADGCGKSDVYDCAASDSYKGTVSAYRCIPEHQRAPAAASPDATREAPRAEAKSELSTLCRASDLPQWKGADAVYKKKLLDYCRAPAGSPDPGPPSP